jgi:phosphatidylglycerophosphatase A
MKQRIIKAIVTGLYTGCIPIAPGTFGSILAFPISITIIWLCIVTKARVNIAALTTFQQELLAIFLILILVCSLIFIIGKILVDEYINETGREDPKEVIIDEIAGQMLTLILSIPNLFIVYNSELIKKLTIVQIDFMFIFFMPFILFRIFDILKPWPINWLDSNIKGGIGVMLDDFAAAIFATIMTYALTFFFIGVVSGA